MIAISILFGLLLFLSVLSLQAQSKKELKAELESLKALKDSLEQKIVVLETPPSADMENEVEKVSYSLGVDVARSFKSQGFDGLMPALVAKGMEDVFGSQEPLIAESEAGRVIAEFFQKMKGKVAADNLAEGQSFLEENKTKEGVMVTESGLQYKVQVAGDGVSPTASDEVTVHYEGRLMDGSIFDSSLERGAPATFRVGQVISGWTEALQMMKVGDKWTLYIPAELGYGERGAGGKIGPNALLIFDVELLEVKGK